MRGVHEIAGKVMSAMCINYHNSTRGHIKRVKKMYTHTHAALAEHISLTNLVNASSGRRTSEMNIIRVPMRLAYIVADQKKKRQQMKRSFTVCA